MNNYFEQATHLFETGNFEEALTNLYTALWNDADNPQMHVLLGEILEAQKLEEQKLKRLRLSIDNPIISTKKNPLHTNTKNTPPFKLSKKVILVGYDRNKVFFAELATVVVVSSKGASIIICHEILNGEKVTIFGTNGKDEEMVVAIVLNTIFDSINKQYHTEIEFSQGAMEWLFSKEQEKTNQLNTMHH